MPTSDPHDYAGSAIEALTEIGKALGMDLPNYDKNPGSLINFGWEAADRINTLTEGTGSNPTWQDLHGGFNGGGEPSHAPTVPTNPLDNPNTVAAFRLPIAVSHLLPISDLMEDIYGPGLMTPSPSQFFVLTRPPADATATDTPQPTPRCCPHNDDSHDGSGCLDCTCNKGPMHLGYNPTPGPDTTNA